MNSVRRKKLDAFLRAYTNDESQNLLGNIEQFEHFLSPDPNNRQKRRIDMQDFDGIWVKKNSRFRNIATHNHSYIEIGYVYSGIINEVIEDHPYQLQKGQLILIDRNTVHSIDYADENDILVSIIASAEACHEVIASVKTDNTLLRFFMNALNDSNHGINYLIFSSEKQDRLQELILELIYEQYFPAQNHDEIMTALFNTALISMMPCINTSVSAKILNKSSATAASALAWIDANYRNCTLQTVANYLGVNPAYLSFLLKNETGQNFKDIITEKKLNDVAKLLLTSERPISEIAENVGYLNLTQFYKKFNKKFGCNPSEYRRIDRSNY